MVIFYFVFCEKYSELCKMRIIKLVVFFKYYMFLKLYIYILFKVKFEMLINIWCINKLKEEEIFLYCIK